MSEPGTSGWNRRELLGGAALLAAALGVPLAALKLSDLAADEAPTKRQRELMRSVSQMVIPRTATAGAGELGVGDFVILALAKGLEKSRRLLPQNAPQALKAHRRADGSLDQLRWLEAELDARVRGDFVGLGDTDQTPVLAALDAEAYAEGVKDHPWRTVKALILTGYYTSEVGGSQELRFELVPGLHDPDVPVTTETRAFSSDWTAVDFG